MKEEDVKELSWPSRSEIDDWRRELPVLRAERERYRRWLRYMRQRWLPLVRLNTLIGGVAEEEMQKIRAAMRGDEPPRLGEEMPKRRRAK